MSQQYPSLLCMQMLRSIVLLERANRVPDYS